MAKSYHNLAGLVRDLRNARGDAADGSETAAKLLDDCFDELDFLLGESSSDDAGGEDDDGDGELDDAAPESPPVRSETSRGVGGVGAPGPRGTSEPAGAANGQRPRQLSTRERIAREARPRPGADVRRLNGRGES